MKSYFAYIRVSTARQGEHGTSPEEQRAAIEAYAKRADLTISEWFNETKSAAKQGRSVFNRMLAGLESKRAAGVVIHKIDRSARNLKDWARLGELMDSGAEVHFVHDNLDLRTRGGRLSADIQAVVAADFIRNLREETLKGRYGRLKQGYYPFPAPRGYLNHGKAQPKTIDPHTGPLVRQAFELYATATYSLDALRVEMRDRGLRRRSSAPLTSDQLSAILRNPFYVGIIRLKATGEVFAGNHKPLVPKALFDQVQGILSGRCYPRVQINRFLFRRLITCERCGRSLTGERKKGHVYYRCHDAGCPGVSIKEERLNELVRIELGHLKLDDGDIGDFRELIEEERRREDESADGRLEQVERDLGHIKERMERLTDAVLDGTIEKATYDERKGLLIAQKLELTERHKQVGSTIWQAVAKRFELGLMALQGYEIGNDDEKREIVKSIGSNFVIQGKQVVFPMFSPFSDIRKWSISTYGLTHRGAARTTTRDSRKRKLRRFVLSLVRAATGIQTVPNDSTTQARARRPDPRPSFARPFARRARRSSRTAPTPGEGAYHDREEGSRAEGAA
jgi:DNA invertase Pin-like site-specific DNA recombinase